MLDSYNSTFDIVLSKASLRKPYTPNDVIPINIVTAIDRYIFMNIPMVFLNRYRKDALINLPISRLAAIIVTEIMLPLNSKAIPLTLKYAAHAAMNSALAPRKVINNLLLVRSNMLQSCSNQFFNHTAQTDLVNKHHV